MLISGLFKYEGVACYIARFKNLHVWAIRIRISNLLLFCLEINWTPIPRNIAAVLLLVGYLCFSNYFRCTVSLRTYLQREHKKITPMGCTRVRCTICLFLRIPIFTEASSSTLKTRKDWLVSPILCSSASGLGTYSRFITLTYIKLYGVCVLLR